MQDRLKLTPEMAALEIAHRALAVAAEMRQRILVGIAGGPGAGKSTLAADVIDILNNRIDGSATRVPMDGFHMMQAKIEAEELTAFKGAPRTYEAESFVQLLRTLKTAKMPVSIPGYSRKLADVVPNAFTIAGNVPILVVEGNYLLLDTPPWDEIEELLDLSFFLHVPEDVIRTRLLKRHAEEGRLAPDWIRRHVEKVDLVNYQVVEDSSPKANVVIEIALRH
jgi:pantothenate kinase